MIATGSYSLFQKDKLFRLFVEHSMIVKAIGTHLLLKNLQLKETDQLTGSFAAATAESKLSELCSYLHLYIPTY